jgi:hypothetical protein
MHNWDIERTIRRAARGRPNRPLKYHNGAAESPGFVG